MKLSRLFESHRVIMDVEATSMEQLLHLTLVQVPDEIFIEASREAVEEVLQEREAAGSIITDGVALPHARFPGLKHPFIAVGIPQEPFEAKSLVNPEQNELVRMAFIIAVPLNQNTLMLQSLAAVQRLLREEPCSKLANIKTPAKFIKHIEETGVDVKKVMTASDIMKADPDVVHPNDLLVDAVKTIAKAGVERLAVVDDEGAPVSEFSCATILQVGVPKHFELLTDPSVLDQFEAFEQYFEKERNLSVKDVMLTEFETVAPTDSVMVIAQRFLKDDKRKLYVVDQGKLIGEVRPRDLVSRVLSA
jgi:mannitol/fructose-specific phosphotransferase system IIA component (Ntr-type)/CBS domain-containing protein